MIHTNINSTYNYKGHNMNMSHSNMFLNVNNDVL